MKPIREIISRQIIEDLWGAGYTILPRRRYADPFFVPEDIIPHGRSYQWMHLVHDRYHFKNNSGGSLGWAPVPASRHDGYFMPAGHIGDIEVNGLGLFEKPKFEVDAEREANIAKAHKQVDDWAKRAAADGLVGEWKIGGESTAIGETKSIENITKIPRELTPYIAQIFEKRDALYSDLVEKWNSGAELTPWQASIKRAYDLQLALTPDAPLGPTLNRLILPTAIENIRKRIKEETNGQAPEH